MTPAELTDLFLARLLKEHGGTRRRWRAVLGPIRLYDVETHPHCNWALDPSGSAAENGAVERIADDLRGKHPILK